MGRFSAARAAIGEGLRRVRRRAGSAAQAVIEHGRAAAIVAAVTVGGAAAEPVLAQGTETPADVETFSVDLAGTIGNFTSSVGGWIGIIIGAALGIISLGMFFRYVYMATKGKAGK